MEYEIKSYANLCGADLRDACLWNADLSNSSLRNANLRNADLSNSDLSNADLSDADLRLTDLRLADLRGANLRGANLRGANLYGVKVNEYTLLPKFQIPQEGELIVWKKCIEETILKLKVPASAKRTASVVGRKCRAEYVETLEIIGGYKKAYSIRDRSVYEVGKVTRPDDYDPNPFVECTHGIHFFLTREEAEEY